MRNPDYNKVRQLNGNSAYGVPGWTAYNFYQSGFGSSMQLKNGATVFIHFVDSGPGGYMWHIRNTNSYATFTIDVNGSAPPNTIGRDIFIFALKGDWNSIVPFYAGTDDCTKDGAGLTCAKKVIADGWTINY